MRVCNYRLIKAIVVLIKMLVECKYMYMNGHNTPYTIKSITLILHFTEGVSNKNGYVTISFTS